MLNFSPPSSQIVISLACRDEYVHASVEDQGDGIPEQERDLIFRRFYTKDTRGGTGLGLAICKGHRRGPHGGEVGVENADKGGSRFWFRIPESEEGRKRPVNKRLLAIDDDPDILRVLKANLELYGYEPVLAESWAGAQDALDKQLPALIILDVMLPDGNGVELCKDLKRRYPKSRSSC